MRATLDLIGLYQYHPTLFDKLVIPEQMDKTVLTDNLLMESAEMEVLYSNADFMEDAIGSWSSKMLGVWDELYKTTQYVYNPIWNKDGTVSETITRNLATTEDITTNVDRSDNLQSKETRDLTDTVDNSVYGFNSSTAAPSDKSEAKGSGTDTFNHTGTQDVDTTVDRDTTDTGTITTERTEQGNIGLTSTQDLITQQREVVKLNLYDVIIKDFIARFCLAVY